jgi:MoaA/NifB/PqqE/SkfB family radical SAM enzyme
VKPRKGLFQIGKVEILMGWRCNCNCIFCSVGHKLREDKRVKSWKDIKADVDFAKESGADIISLSGGEPTIRPDIFRTIEYARQSGFKTIEIQTNARLLSYMDFARKILGLGANRFLISMHAHNQELGDFLVCSKGGWNQAIQGIRNLKSLGMENIRFSTVACEYNYRQFPEIMEFLLQFDGVGYHTGLVIPDGYAYKNSSVIPRISDVAPYMKKAVEKILVRGKEAWVYSIPHCMLRGYEHVIAEMGSGDTILRGPDFEASIQRNRRKHRTKPENCRQCRYDKICIGVWKRYGEIHGLGEFRPVRGEKIEDSTQFMKQVYKD